MSIAVSKIRGSSFRNLSILITGFPGSRIFEILRSTWIIQVSLLFLLSGTATADSPFVLNVKKVSSAPVIDGNPADTIWSSAAVAENFIQYEPDRGNPSESRTRAMVLYDSDHIYLAFQLWDNEKPTAQLTRRDADLFEDDAVIVILDSYSDRRTAYYFMTNALATQTDGRIADDGRTVDNTWDAPGTHRGSVLRKEQNSGGRWKWPFRFRP